MTRIVAALLLVLAVDALQAAEAQPASGRFKFALVGDMPYWPHEELELERFMDDWERRSLAFAFHVGDIKAGVGACDDATLESRRRLLDASPVPLVLVPGDNEWTDCHRAAAGGFEPEERLARLRGLFFSGSGSLGRRRIALDRQLGRPGEADYPENARFEHRGVLFVMLNVPGSNNNLGRSADADEEFVRRGRANHAWLEEAFRRAGNASIQGMVIVFHADPWLGRGGPGRVGRGYRDLVRLLERRASRLLKPLLLVNGDSHRYRLDRPLLDPAAGKALERARRVVTYGSPRTGWVLVSVDPRDPELFSVEPVRAED